MRYVAALESEFAVEPCATNSSAASDLYSTSKLTKQSRQHTEIDFPFFLRDLCGLCVYILSNEI